MENFQGMKTITALNYLEDSLTQKTKRRDV